MLRTTVTESDTVADEFWFLCLQHALTVCLWLLQHTAHAYDFLQEMSMQGSCLPSCQSQAGGILAVHGILSLPLRQELP